MQFSSISEDKRVAFTKQLRDFRDSDSNQLVFSAVLTTDERKFVHKISQDFGLKSKSQGLGVNRFISVLKKNSNAQKGAGLAPMIWHPHHLSSQLLSTGCFAAVANNKNYQNSINKKGKPSQRQQQVTAQCSPQDEQKWRALQESYYKAQAARASNKGYAEIQRKRSLLPASHHRMAVCSLLREHQIVLISGETGMLYFLAQ
jgi:hypothetical protein